MHVIPVTRNIAVSILTQILVSEQNTKEVVKLLQKLCTNTNISTSCHENVSKDMGMLNCEVLLGKEAMLGPFSTAD